MANNTTLRDGNGALFTAESVDVGAGIQRASTAANLRVGNIDVAVTNPVPVMTIVGGSAVSPANPLPVTLNGASLNVSTPLAVSTDAQANAAAPVTPEGAQVPLSVDLGRNLRITEGAGAAITGTALPSGGVGLTGWLSAIWARLSGTLTVGGTVTANVVGGNTTALKVDGSAVTQPIAGSVMVTTLPALPTGGNAIGSVSVTALPSLPAGANALGSVTVSSIPSLPSGINLIGKIGMQVAGSDIAVSNPVPTQPSLGGAAISSSNPLPVAISSAVSVSNLPATQAVSGSVAVSNLPATQAISGSVSVSNFPATQAISGTVALSGLPALAAGSNAIGSVIVSSHPALAPGANVIGKVGLQVAGSDVASANPVPVSFAAGSVGADYSANRPTIPNVGAAFAATGPYASYALIATVPASATRASVDIENTSGAQVAVMRDDGTAASGAAPANASVFALAGGSAAGAQGGAWSSTTFKGRIQVYAPTATAQVAIFTE